MRNKVKIVMKPDFENCILNVTSSIMAHFGINSPYKANEQVLLKLKNAKHIFLVILDGLGKNIIEKNLSSSSFIRTHLTDWISTVFPPTTVAATTSALSGLAPGETGWIGWHQYFKDIDEDVVLFRNFTQVGNVPMPFIVTDRFIPYQPFYEKFNNVSTKELYPGFKKDGFSTFKEMGEEIIRISHSSENTYTYCYWDNPDKLLHEYGTTDSLVKQTIQTIDNELDSIYQSLGPDSTLIMIADHGLVDTSNLYLVDYPDIVACLKRRPTIETRTCSFEVNDLDKFKELFNKYFGKWFTLYDKDTFLQMGYLGSNYQKAIPYLGDYIAIAIDQYCLCYEPSDTVFKANHAGGMKEEMIVPLVILAK